MFKIIIKRHKDIEDDLKSLSLTSDLIKCLIEVLEKIILESNLQINILEVLKLDLYHFMIQLIQIRHYLSILLDNFQLNSNLNFEITCSLGEDIWFITELLMKYSLNHLFIDDNLFQQIIQFFNQQFHLLLNQEINLSERMNIQLDIRNDNNNNENNQFSSLPLIGYRLTYQYFHQSEIFYQNYLHLSTLKNDSKSDNNNDDDDDNDTVSSYTILLFNFSCILFKLRMIESSIEYLIKYIQIMLNENTKEEILNEILNEKDLHGLNESLLFQEKIEPLLR